MTKIYLTKVIGEGTMINPRKPEVDGDIFWTVIEDLGDFMIIEADPVNVRNFDETVELA